MEVRKKKLEGKLKIPGKSRSAEQIKLEKKAPSNF